MKIISGKTGSPHVTSQQFRQIFEGIIGEESCILPCGENLTPELQTNNSLKIRSGLMYHHGNLSTVELGTYDEVTIQNGTQGMKRIDLVVNRYTREEESGTEKNEWVVIQGTPHASSPVVPDYTEGNLQDGDLVDDCPYLEVHLDGINVTEVKQLLSVADAMSTINKYLSETLITGDMFAFQDFYDIVYVSGKKIGKTLYFSAELLYTGSASTMQPNQYYELNRPESADPAVIPKNFNVLNVTAVNGSYTHAINGFAQITKDGLIEFSLPEDPVEPTYIFISGIYETAN